jgi:hypothetical protein
LFDLDANNNVEISVIDSVNVEKTPIDHSQCTEIDNVDAAYLGKYVAVLYEGVPYPGLVVDVDEESIQVKCMQKVGKNRYFWPAKDDIVWYEHEHIVQTIPEPLNVTRRHLQVDPKIWEEIFKKFE